MVRLQDKSLLILPRQGHPPRQGHSPRQSYPLLLSQCQDVDGHEGPSTNIVEGECIKKGYRESMLRK